MKANPDHKPLARPFHLLLVVALLAVLALGITSTARPQSSLQIERTKQFGAVSLKPDAPARTVDADGNIYVARFTYGTLPGPTGCGHLDALIPQYDSSGTSSFARHANDAIADSNVTVASIPGPTIQYDHGNPSDDEQVVLEMINRARQNPFAEGARLGIDITEGLEGFIVEPQPPLAMNKKLHEIARAHSEDMYTRSFFSHTNPDGKTQFDRMHDAGYDYVLAGENIAFCSEGCPAEELEDMLMIDADFPGRGHRKNLLSPYREVGIGFYQGSAAFMTQDFGTQTDSTALIVGVAYNDTNGNSFYDRGEGLAGVQIMPDAGTYYAVTSSSGGYAIPVTAGSLLTVVASGGALPGPMERTVDVSQSGDNVKLDFLANTLPVASDLSIVPASPLTTDHLLGSYTYSDADGDPESGSKIGWYKDSVLQAAHNDLLTVPSSATSKGEAWYFAVTPSDGTDYGILQTSPNVTIGNSAPTVSDLGITPASPSTTDHLLGSYTYSDPDADPESGSEIRWYKDAVLQTTYNDLLTIPSSATSKGEAWYFTVTPNDGTSFGQLQTSASVTIGDTVPVGGEAYPENTISVLAPWVAAAVLLAGGAGWYVLRRRGTQS